jgi:predicted AAA+ superfamily ATPase
MSPALIGVPVNLAWRAAVKYHFPSRSYFHYLPFFATLIRPIKPSIFITAGIYLLKVIFQKYLLSHLNKNVKRKPIYFYRDKDQKEIDLLIIQDGTVYPLEFKKSASPGKDAVRNFRLLEKLNMPIGPGGVICLAERSLMLTPTTTSIPVSAI